MFKSETEICKLIMMGLLSSIKKEVETQLAGAHVFGRPSDSFDNESFYVYDFMRTAVVAIADAAHLNPKGDGGAGLGGSDSKRRRQEVRRADASAGGARDGKPKGRVTWCDQVCRHKIFQEDDCPRYPLPPLPKDKDKNLLCIYHYWGITGICGSSCTRYSHDRTYKDDIKSSEQAPWARGPPHDRKPVRGDRKPQPSFRRGFDDQVRQQRALLASMDDNASVLSQARSTKSDSSLTSEFAKLESRVSALNSDISSLSSRMRALLTQGPPSSRKAAHDDDAGNEFSWDP